MFHRSTGSTRRQRISALVLALTLILTMAFPAVAAPSRPDPYYSDFGDLPATYPTSTADAPVHQLQLVPGGLMLGQCVDGEPNGQPSATAKGDDDAIGHPAYGVPSCASDDEDGVTRVAGKGGASNGGGWTNGTVLSGNGGAVQLTITGGSACLGAYFDLLRNGTLPLATLRNADNSPVTQPIAAGTYTYYFDIPDGTFNGTPPGQPIYARFRVTSPVGTTPTCADSPVFLPTGPAPDGEVEDYRWNFGPNAVTLSGMTATPLALPLGIVTFLGVLVGGIVLARRPV